MILGAAISAINQKDNVFKAYYERMVQDGVISSNARHAVARKMLTVMWGRLCRGNAYGIEVFIRL